MSLNDQGGGGGGGGGFSGVGGGAYGTASTGYTPVASDDLYTGGLSHTVNLGGGRRAGGRPLPIDPAKLLALTSGMVVMGSVMLLLSLGSIAPLEVGLLSNDITA